MKLAIPKVEIRITISDMSLSEAGRIEDLIGELYEMNSSLVDHTWVSEGDVSILFRDIKTYEHFQRVRPVMPGGGIP